MTASGLRVTGLYRYPIKSCAEEQLSEATLDARGLVHDRELCVVDDRGRFRTQRELPRMALIRPRIMDGELRVEAPGQPVLHTPVLREGPTISATVWDDSCEAVDQGDPAAQWFSEFLQRPCRLVRMSEHFHRRVDPTYAPRPSDEVGFADGFPILLLSEESLGELNHRLDQPLPMNRFRPNLVISGGEPYVEDELRRIRIGELELAVVKPCARCTITTTDQQTAARGKEPLATLSTYRKVQRGVMFGQNVVHLRPGTIAVGSPVEVLERGPPRIA